MDTYNRKTKSKQDELAAMGKILTWKKNPKVTLRDSHQELEKLNEELKDRSIEGLPPLVIANQYLHGFPFK